MSIDPGSTLLLIGARIQALHPELSTLTWVDTSQPEYGPAYMVSIGTNSELCGERLCVVVYVTEAELLYEPADATIDRVLVSFWDEYGYCETERLFTVKLVGVEIDWGDDVRKTGQG